MINAFKYLNLAIRFLLELCLLAIFGYWGFTGPGSFLSRLVIGTGSLFLVILTWGLFIAPKASRRLPDPRRSMLELVIFGLAALALASRGQIVLGGVFAAVYLANKLLVIFWRQQA